MGTVEGLTNTELLQLDKIPNYQECDIIEALQDGVSIMEALPSMDPSVFSKSQTCYDEEDPYQAFKNYQTVVMGLNIFYKNFHGFTDQ